jgi:hypothetical protein
MTPKIIWQTYEVPFDQLPQYIKDCAQTWKDNNPQWEYRYMDAKERNEFVLNNFDKEWHDIFTKLPYGVLQSDVWRHMVLFVYGGVYADLDAVCNKPIETWLNNNMNTTVFIDDGDKHFCQFLIASIPKNIVYKNLLDFIKNRLMDKDFIKNYLNKKIQIFEENTTGAIACTEAIRLFLNIPSELDLVRDYKKINDIKEVKENKFFYYNKKVADRDLVKHFTGSKVWTSDYIRWQEQEPIKKGFL